MPSLIERRGTIINVGSAITYLANSGLGAYGAAKAGLGYWNDALRTELLHKGVKVCLVEPGPVKTEFFDALMTLAPPGGRYNPLLDAPLPWMAARVDDVARRIVRLIERPKRRLQVLRRVVWPFRLLGGLFRICPPLGDLALSTLTQHLERRGDLCRTHVPVGDAPDGRVSRSAPAPCRGEKVNRSPGQGASPAARTARSEGRRPAPGAGLHGESGASVVGPRSTSSTRARRLSSKRQAPRKTLRLPASEGCRSQP